MKESAETAAPSSGTESVTQVFRDSETGEYIIIENCQERVLTVDEIYELTGSRPATEQQPEPAVDAETHVDLATVDNDPAVVEAATVEPTTSQSAEPTAFSEENQPLPVVPDATEPVVEPAAEPVAEATTAEMPETRDEVAVPESAELAEDLVEPLVANETADETVDEAIDEPASQAPPVRTVTLEDYEDFADEDAELEWANQRLEQQRALDAAAGPGPATAANQANRNVGAKKLKNLERKDQRRAYFEHQRMQAMVERQEEEEYQNKFGDLIEAEREARRLADEAAEAERKEAQRKQREEEEARKLEREQVRKTLEDLKSGESIQLETDLEKELAQTLVGSVSNLTESPFVVDNGNWIVKFSEEDLQKLADAIADKGSMTFDELAATLSEIKK